MQIKRMSYTDLNLRKKELERAVKIFGSKKMKQELGLIKAELKTRFNPAAKVRYYDEPPGI